MKTQTNAGADGEEKSRSSSGEKPADVTREAKQGRKGLSVEIVAEMDSIVQSNEWSPHRLGIRQQ